MGYTLSISDNGQLSSLKGLGSLTSIGGQLAVINNPALGSLADLDGSLTTVGQTSEWTVQQRPFALFACTLST